MHSFISIYSQRKLPCHPMTKEVVLMDSYLSKRTVALPPRQSK